MGFTGWGMVKGVGHGGGAMGWRGGGEVVIGGRRQQQESGGKGKGRMVVLVVVHDGKAGLGEEAR
uniref:Uncharacterized protein n=1 Tax=Fagus sylvatica TaxID=28930 RepID=A0A2N9GSK2_FAGSY